MFEYMSFLVPVKMSNAPLCGAQFQLRKLYVHLPHNIANLCINQETLCAK